MISAYALASAGADAARTPWCVLVSMHTTGFSTCKGDSQPTCLECALRLPGCAASPTTSRVLRLPPSTSVIGADGAARRGSLVVEVVATMHWRSDRWLIILLLDVLHQRLSACL
jgi:hypothetical protein